MFPRDTNIPVDPSKDGNLPTTVHTGRAVGYPRPYGYPDAPADAFDGDGFDIRKYLRILYKRRWLILGCMGVSALLGIIASYLMTPIYQAIATLQIDREAASLVQID